MDDAFGVASAGRAGNDAQKRREDHLVSDGVEIYDPHDRRNLRELRVARATHFGDDRSPRQSFISFHCRKTGNYCMQRYCFHPVTQ